MVTLTDIDIIRASWLDPDDELAQVVETSVNVTTNTPSQDYTHLDNHTSPTYDMTPGFKPFTVFVSNLKSVPVVIGHLFSLCHISESKQDTRRRGNINKHPAELF